MTVYIVGDFGGTNGRLAISTPEGMTRAASLVCANFADPGALIRAYCEEQGMEMPAQGVFAVAGPMKDPAAFQFTNGPWSGAPVDFTNFGIKPFLMNDFAAQAYATRVLKSEDYVEVVEGRPAFFPSTLTTDTDGNSASQISKSDPRQRIVIMGPGTGLGVATASVVDGKFVAEDCEGGHMAWPVKTEKEFMVAQVLRLRGYENISFETVACGPGLVRVFNILTGSYFKDIKPEGVVAMVGKETGADIAMDIFTRALGRCASAAALAKNAQGGIVIAGGIIAKLGDAFDAAKFREEFRANDLGANNILANVPVHAVINPNSGLLGAHAYAQLHLK